MPPMPMDIETMTGAMEFGTRWRNMIVRSGTPSATCARMKSCSRSDRIWPRINRAYPGQDTSASAPEDYQVVEEQRVAQEFPLRLLVHASEPAHERLANRQADERHEQQVGEGEDLCRSVA